MIVEARTLRRLGKGQGGGEVGGADARGPHTQAEGYLLPRLQQNTNAVSHQIKSKSGGTEWLHVRESLDACRVS